MAFAATASIPWTNEPLCAIRAQYLEQDECVYTDGLLSPEVLESVIHEAEQVRSQACRKSVPGYKASSSVSHDQIARMCPTIIELFHSEEFLKALCTITGLNLMPCPARDMHAAAIYNYTRPGDAIGYHYDVSHYQGTRITVLIGLVNQSESKLVCQLYTKRTPKPPAVELAIATNPGTVVIFNGDRLLHKVTPLGENQRRMVLSLQYVTSQKMAKSRMWLNDFKDALTYFGFGHWLRRTFARAPRLASPPFD
ncbi:MAG: 2OG-Fe(II) oxygenase [Myxococcales bacterium]|nr:2OG-Fe(II) oxygenase [Myxococcales bacterium]